MRLIIKGFSKPSKLAAFFKGRRWSTSEKRLSNEQEKNDLFGIRLPIPVHVAEEEDLKCVHNEVNEGEIQEAEHLIILYRILQEQMVNSTEVYNIAGQMVTVEVLEDTEF